MAATIAGASSERYPMLAELAHILERPSLWNPRSAAAWLLHLRATNRRRSGGKELIELLEDHSLREAIPELEARR